MPAKAIPLLHVPDVKATVAWYESIGFSVRAVHQELGCPMDWACVVLGESEVMFSVGGATASRPRRDADLYLQVDDVAERYRLVRPLAEIVEGLHETHYGMREFIVKNPNGFWLTFGQPATPG